MQTFNRFSVFIFLLIPFLSIGQISISGVIKDSKTKAPLPFATIITSNGSGTITDTEGKFNIPVNSESISLTITYIGYKKQKVSLTASDNFYTILLEPSFESLQEVLVVAKENPALAIIKNTIKSKNNNNISKALGSFKYKLYNKIIVTANPDSIDGKIDSVFFRKNDSLIFVTLDSSNYNFKKK